MYALYERLSVRPSVYKLVRMVVVHIITHSGGKPSLEIALSFPLSICMPDMKVAPKGPRPPKITKDH